MPSPTDHTVTLSPEMERRRLVTVAQAAVLKAISEEAFRNHFAHLIRQITPGRQGVRLGDVLED
jgi:hypothetical protein